MSRFRSSVNGKFLNSLVLSLNAFILFLNGYFKVFINVNMKSKENDMDRNIKSMVVPYLAHVDENSSLESISLWLDSLIRNPVEMLSWPVYSYKPAVTFSIGYSRKAILIKFYVEELFVRATYYKANDPVYRDSCVEFFIAFEEGGYYNLEFNCIGTCLIGYGASREDRIFISEESISKIKYKTVLEVMNDPADKFIKWELTLKIPASVFSKHEIKDFKGRTCRGNFYKCGDDLPQPHFLSWSPINAPEPDFHRPEYFGDLIFD
jgi:Carbohydrate-binding family 9